MHVSKKSDSVGVLIPITVHPRWINQRKRKMNAKHLLVGIGIALVAVYLANNVAAVRSLVGPKTA